MNPLNIAFHAACILMIVIGAFFSVGVCVTGFILEGLAWTGVLGSIIAAFKKKDA